MLRRAVSPFLIKNHMKAGKEMIQGGEGKLGFK